MPDVFKIAAGTGVVFLLLLVALVFLYRSNLKAQKTIATLEQSIASYAVAQEKLLKEQEITNAILLQKQAEERAINSAAQKTIIKVVKVKDETVNLDAPLPAGIGNNLGLLWKSYTGANPEAYAPCNTCAGAPHTGPTAGMDDTGTGGMGSGTFGTSGVK